MGGHLVTGGPQRPGKKESVVRRLFAVTLTAATLSEPGVGVGGRWDSFSPSDVAALLS